MLQIVLNFIELVDNDVPTNDDHLLHNLNLELDEEDDTDDPDMGAEAFGLDLDDDMDEM